MTLNIGSLSGIIIALQMLICVAMTLISHKTGGTLAQMMMIFSLTSMGSFLLTKRNLAVAPGIAMLIMGLTIISILKVQLRLREKEIYTDYLTGLYNRRGIINRLEKLSSGNKPFYLMYIDIDEFKFINDSYGHKSGDKVLQTVSERINSVLDKKCPFGRIGGDEFIILLPHPNDAEGVAESILKLINQEIYLEASNISCYVTASIGITSFPSDSKNSGELIRFSDIAMYHAKKSGKNRIQFFNQSLEALMTRESEIETIIKDALAKNLFDLVFQPQFETNTKKLRGFETLLRLLPDNYEATTTAELITVAEKTDLIFEIDDFVLEKAICRFRDTVYSCGQDFTVSINVSAKNISRSHFAEKVQKTLEKYDFPSKCLEIEITEYCLVQSLETTLYNIQKLKNLGVQIALDDFGTGYASLSYLSKLPVDLLKIDKSFIDSLEYNSVNSDFINAVISMGHLLGCKVISEGVETQAQLDMLKQKNCDYIQGYIWGKPLRFEEAVQLCEKK